MKNLMNIGGVERLRRIMISIIVFIIGFFWFGGLVQVSLFILSAILFLTGISGFCPLYTVFKIQRYKKDSKIPKICWIIFTIVFLLVTVGWSYASIFFSKKFFLEDYNKMNNYYKQTLFNTGKEKRPESIANYDSLVSEYAIFSEKYTNYHPYSLRSDANLNSDIAKISTVIASQKEAVYTGNLKQSHLDFEKVRPIFQDILKRNNFSLLAISLVDFHDVMEGVIDAADKKDITGVAKAYLIADEKLKAVELEANDEEIQTIRKNLEEVRSLAEQNKLETISAKAADLKASFVKVYLKRG